METEEQGKVNKSDDKEKKKRKNKENRRKINIMNKKILKALYKCTNLNASVSKLLSFGHMIVMGIVEQRLGGDTAHI